MDEHVVKAVVNLDDPEIVLDLRNTNGKPKLIALTLIDFWAELQAYLDEVNLAGDDRRHGTHYTYLSLYQCGIYKS